MENCGLRCGYCNGVGHTKERCWKRGKQPKANYVVNKYLEAFVNDEATTLEQLNQLCGTKHDIFIGTRIPKKEC
jgi:hypothetical protein